MKSIFLTYNQGSGIGKNTALRMQTISNLYGLSVFLPVRAMEWQSTISEETKRRIQASTFVVSFALETLTADMQEELNYAIKLNKPIVVLYDKEVGQTIDFGDYKNYTANWIDYDNTEKTLHDVALFLDKMSPSGNPQAKKESNAGTALVGIGLGLLALWAISKN